MFLATLCVKPIRAIRSFPLFAQSSNQLSYSFLAFVSIFHIKPKPIKKQIEIYNTSDFNFARMYVPVPSRNKCCKFLQRRLPKTELPI